MMFTREELNLLWICVDAALAENPHAGRELIIEQTRERLVHLKISIKERQAQLEAL